MVGSRTPLSDDAIISDMDAPKDRIERALCLFVFMSISPCYFFKKLGFMCLGREIYL
jgi:hypothetical protein